MNANGRNDSGSSMPGANTNATVRASSAVCATISVREAESERFRGSTANEAMRSTAERWEAAACNEASR